MKKSLVLASALLAFAFSAQAVEVTTNVGATSNYIDRGASLSGKDLSTTAGIKATLDNGVFGAAQVSSVRLPGADTESKATVGYAKTVNGVAFTGGYTQRFYNGGARADRLNFGEAFGTAAYKGADVYVGQTLDRSAFSGRDTYVRLGYTYALTEKLSANAGYAFTRYRNEGVIRHNATDATLAYQVLPNTKVFATYSLGGNGVRDHVYGNQAAVGVNVSF